MKSRRRESLPANVTYLHDRRRPLVLGQYHPRWPRSPLIDSWDNRQLLDTLRVLVEQKEIEGLSVMAVFSDGSYATLSSGSVLEQPKLERALWEAALASVSRAVKPEG